MIASSNVTTTQVSLADWLNNPPPRTEWSNGTLRQKRNMTLKHSKIQRRLSTLWSLHVDAHHLGGEVYTEAPCQTQERGRSPDVAYLTPELLAQYGDAKVLPQSFPLSGEIVSPTDLAEDIIAKAEEYLSSGGDEVWLVYPEAGWILVITVASRQIFSRGEIATTQLHLPGFQVSVDELLA
jgi:Uma2 family endonuclease